MPSAGPTVDGMAEALPALTWAGAPGGPGWLRPLDRLLVIIRRACETALVLCIVTMVFGVTVQVAARYVFEVVVIGPAEIARYAMTTAVFLGLPVLAATMTHIRLDAAFTALPSQRLRRGLVLVVLVFELAFTTAFAWLSWELVASLLESQQRSAALEVRLLWPTMPILVGSALAAVVTAGVLVRTVVLGPPDQAPA
jgi:TRAP-type C4-dicarboxylate transport system permease small subunit